MVSFRRCITALAVLALFAGLASAQVYVSTAGTGSFACIASVAVPPTLRAEGLTELVGDIVLTCTGGPPMNLPSSGAQTPIQTANITVSFGTNVTSRLLTYASVAPSAITAANTSEALLLIDQPGSGLTVAGPNGTPSTGGPAGWGPGAPQVLCGVTGTPSSLVGAGPGGCLEYPQQVGGDFVMTNLATVSGSASSPANVGANMFAGVVNSNQVTFYGIPIMPPASAGVARIYRMTNMRVNANALGGGGLAGTTQVLASISISGNTSVLVQNPVQISGFIQSGLATGLRNIGNSGGGSAANFNQCSSASTSSVNILRYSELFGTAFKTRVSPINSSAGAGQAMNTGSPGQNIPGTIYNSESGFITPLITGTSNGSVAGLADYGTRLKAVFNNVPSTVRIFVSTTNVINLTGLSGSNALLTPPPGNSTTSYAQLVLSETGLDGAGSAPTVPAAGYTSPSGSIVQLVGYAELAVVNGTATGVWEVINTNSATPENFDFGVWITYTANPGSNLPPPGTATVNMSYAPTPPAFTASAGAAVSGTLTVPRFADTSSAVNLLNINICQTSLLFPFITNQAGFDTGIAIMNTSTDPFGTKPQAGTCALNFYGQNAPPVYTTTSLASASPDPTKYAFLASVIAPNFEGYMIAVCNFQYAHGYSYVSDLGSRNLAHGYLALIMAPNPTATARNASTPETLGN